MPKLKQPRSLKGLAFNLLVKHTVRCCDAISNKGSLDELCESITAVKGYLSEHLSSSLFADFCMKFLQNFHKLGYWRLTDDRPTGHQKASLEIMMDVEMVGLTCHDPILCYLDPGDAHRIHGWKTICFFPRVEYIPKGLENYRLDDLTTLRHPAQCTDSELEIIGRSCPKLQIMNVEASTQVTDKGLRALRRCSELRIIDIRECGVSGDGVNELLECHEKLEDFQVGNKRYGTPGPVFDVTQCQNSLVHPSMKRFSLKCYGPQDEHLHSILAVFPNLTHLEFRCKFVSDPADLCVLKDLKNLKVIDFLAGNFSMDNIRELLMSVGENLTGLRLRWEDAGVTQNDLDFIFRVCGILESLDICYIPSESRVKLTIPPFKKLKYFSCWVDDLYSESQVQLEFSKMLSLEIIDTQDVDGVFEMIELMVLDDTKFPNLREVRKVYSSKIDDLTTRIVEVIAKNKNLDFSLTRLYEVDDAIDWDDEQENME